MNRFRRRATVGAVLAGCAMVNLPSAVAAPVPGGTLDPLSIPKYVTPLVIPPVLHDDAGAPMEVEVSVRQISQQVLPLTDINGNTLPPTPLWAYGDPANPATFNNPGFTIEVTNNTMSQVTWRNELVQNPANCDNNKAKFVKGQGQGPGPGPGASSDTSCNFLPHIIQDQNGAPVVDQTLHWAAPNQDCRDGIARTDCRGASDQPYTGPIPMVTHVHGAHVGPVSDGYPEAWWLPAADNIPLGYATSGTFFDDISPGNSNRGDRGLAVFEYTNDQPTTTLWYHDHSLGITRLNVYAAGAGFWLIRDANDGETGLISGVLPGPAPKAGDDPNGDPAVRNAIREIPIAIQPKSFNADGSQYYPADRAFFEGLGTGGIFADNTGINMPFLPQATSDIAPVWNPEAFFNTMVVNGNTWPQLEVAQERYRLRFVNASDSRFLNMALRVVNSDGTLGQELPFYMIGTDQGLLPAVVRIETGFATTLPGNGSDVGDVGGPTPVPGADPDQALLMGPAERTDLIVDFSGLATGTVVRMINTAPDAPFGGFGDPAADPATTGQVMQFVVNPALNNPNPNGDPSTPAASLVLDTNPSGDPKLGASTVTQDLALLEEESALLCVTIDAVTGVIDLVPGSVPPACAGGGEPFAPKEAVLGVSGAIGGVTQLWDDPISTNPAVGDIQTWELWNWSADAHPIHLHLVKFEVVDRQIIGGAARAPEPWEAGWKDTVIAYPGEVTRVKAQFDIPGLYVWHCHILSHEDNEMMVPYCVGTPGVDCPAELF